MGAVLTTREKELFDAAHPGERIGGRFVYAHILVLVLGIRGIEASGNCCIRPLRIRH